MGLLLRRHYKVEERAKEPVPSFDMTVKELKEALDKKAIEYDSKVKKDELVALLEKG